MNARVDVATDADETCWSQYAEAKAPAHHAYSWHWRSIIHDVFGHNPYYLISRTTVDSTERVVGILPLYHVKSILFGSALVSLPYLNCGGIIGDDTEAELSLLAKAKELGEELDVKYLELRHREKNLSLDSNLASRSHKVAMVLSIERDPEALFKRFPAKLRSQIRRPSKSGVVANCMPADSQAVNKFYDVFAENMRDLGTPVFPKALFEEAAKKFSATARIVIVSHESNDIAAGMLVGTRGNIEIPWASTLRRYNPLSPNMLLYWEAIQRACIEGYDFFDFGRSTAGSGTHRFKEQWGAKNVPLHWYYDVRHGETPDVNPSSPKFELMVKCWRQLPLPIANLVGPYITRSLP
jgi:serine/alanine adding enzyme